MECGLEIRAEVRSLAVPVGVEDKPRVPEGKPRGLWVANRRLVLSGLGWPEETWTCLVWLATDPGHLGYQVSPAWWLSQEGVRF